ncbi:hypothetical protein LCGC14_0603860 [marine sediment metagenome]|uniref:DOD-type homing endonuclease domain-containing protein n=1 Tax=marine sediment metagenome TaxID=412755 RepID=A0A0F9TVX2_9ZZZZ
MNHQLPAGVQAEAVRLYDQGLSITAAAARLQISRTGCYNALCRHTHLRSPGPARSCRVDADFFSRLDDELPAYWLGFLTADGHVSDKAVQLQLSTRDAEHVRNFATDLDSTYAVRTQGRMTTTAIYSPALVKSLRQLGLSRRKSHTVKPAAIPDSAMRHYWRGLVDGDGCIRVDRRSGFIVDLCGSRFIVDGFRRFVYAVLGKEQRIHPHGSIYAIRYHGAFALELAAYLYVAVSRALSRKRAVIEREVCYAG